MQQCATLPQLVSYLCLAAAMGHSVMALSRLCPCPHTTHHHHITLHITEPSQWWAWQRAGPGSAANPAAPRPAPARPGPSTAPDTAFRFHCPPQPAPARPRRRAGPALRTRTTPHISCSLLAGQHAVTAGPQHHHHRPLQGAAAAGGVAGAGRGPAGGSPAQPPPGTAARGRAGRGRHWPHTTTAQQQRRGKILAKTQSAQLLHT